MKKSEMFGITLEADDRTEEERSRGKVGKKDGLVSALSSSKDGPKVPMDTDYEEELEESKQNRFDLTFDKGIRGLGEPSGSREGKLFTLDRLFEAAGSGDVMKLDGLHQYLHCNMQKLSDMLYQSYGKTPLMKALLHLTDGKNSTVEFFLEISNRMGDIKEFVNKAYTSNYYKGQTALHIAVERRSLFYVRLLVSKGADVHARACGKFFQLHDEPSFYFGELPLSLAACTNQPDVVDFLMDNEYQRADATQTDSQGNTVLHTLVALADNSKENTDFVTNIYDRILTITIRLHPKLQLEDIENKDGLTPLKMAAKTGKIGLFSHILKREFQDSHTKHLSRKFTEWIYGPVHCSLYDLTSVDSYETNSVLEILVYGSDIPNRHEMLQTEPLSQLLEEKWKMFASRIFFFNFIVYILYLMVFTVVAYNKKDGQLSVPVEHTAESYLYLSGQLVMALASCFFFFVGIIDMKRKRPKLKTLLIDGYYDILFFLQAILFLVSAGLYLGGRPEYLSFLVLCLALSWVNLLYFSRGDKHMGIYSVMIQKMILSDILRFLFVYVVFLFGFSAAVVTLLIEPEKKNITPTQKSRIFSTTGPGEECVKPTFRDISYTTLQLFKFTIGMGDMEFTEGYQYKVVFYILLIGYIILTYILLLNMLIALMNRTVEKITMESASIWKLQRAITILDMERRLPHCVRTRLRCGVEKNVGVSPGEDRRRCFRVEEVNWNKWNINVGKINEDPGWSDGGRQPATVSTTRSARTGRSWRGFFSESRRNQTHQSTELSPLTTTPL
ncbi:transient receptor potential cation channel subfamily V member 1 [Thalassophryne amazonica]|uniref:transient receptor potential cation channel subfamily V member 1 n=1 Tax=Thalassophryne amazonica TaxID=390379 RepID=UPI0014720E07|nr:transient receptor potential cation channel subfamily V member 1 [Thalassophryne amazonica]XP_034033403.1 transient receptor potential cation channel subfamily V member 1 [Thalassophryne amazonica]XP_034033404.1 transient receptor potential cation channel subfamily V member 1 [Thalassophryne amazonica]XP_034033405.1 transient receptor potential cation channel subfamily V member 1 [Thalassophryne amazonica]XP_034033406.1 transient receptor potential cation channel subfamily V member 1 [Thalas